MISPFRLDWLLNGGCDIPVSVRPATGEPASQDGPRYRPHPESVPDTEFYKTGAEVAAAEAAVLGDLADLIAGRKLSPWAAADLLFNHTITIGESDGRLA